MRKEHVRQAATSFPRQVDQARNAEYDSTNHFLRTIVEEKPIWISLFESLCDTLCPLRLPSLDPSSELPSTPIVLPDLLAGRTNPWAIGSATVMNAGLVAIFILLGLRSTISHLPPSAPASEIQLKDLTLVAPPSFGLARGGGGGGANQLMDPVTGRLPNREQSPIVPPQPPVLQNPKIAVDPAIAVPLAIKLPDNPLLPVIGVHNSPNVQLASGGPGRSGLGTGSNGGDGPDNGSGYGPGADHGFGGSVYSPGVGGVSKPVPVFSPAAEFSDEARRQKYQGVCIVSIIVDARGYPVDPRVTRSLGMGLDEKALEAVQRYRFKPAMKDGKPVASFVNVEINFRMY
jgi:periplasmic protein TonB